MLSACPCMSYKRPSKTTKAVMSYLLFHHKCQFYFSCVKFTSIFISKPMKFAVCKSIMASQTICCSFCADHNFHNFYNTVAVMFYSQLDMPPAHLLPCMLITSFTLHVFVAVRMRGKKNISKTCFGGTSCTDVN